MFILAADIDGDGQKDLVSGGWWWENPGDLGGEWTRHEIGPLLRNMAAAASPSTEWTSVLLSTTVGQPRDQSLVSRKKFSDSRKKTAHGCRRIRPATGAAKLELGNENQAALSVSAILPREERP